MFRRLVNIFKSSRPPIPIDVPANWRKCDICRIPGSYTGPYTLQRPICCTPLVICAGHTHKKVCTTWNLKCKDCPVHRISSVPEIEYIRPMGKNKRKNKSRER